jgi:hypothetical protein
VGTPVLPPSVSSLTLPISSLGLSLWNSLSDLTLSFDEEKKKGEEMKNREEEVERRRKKNNKKRIRE